MALDGFDLTATIDRRLAHPPGLGLLPRIRIGLAPLVDQRQLDRLLAPLNLEALSLPSAIREHVDVGLTAAGE